MTSIPRITKYYTIADSVVTDLILNSDYGKTINVTHPEEDGSGTLTIDQSFGELTILNPSSRDIYVNYETDKFDSLTLNASTDGTLIVAKGQFISIDFPYLFKRLRIYTLGTGTFPNIYISLALQFFAINRA